MGTDLQTALGAYQAYAQALVFWNGLKAANAPQQQIDQAYAVAQTCRANLLSLRSAIDADFAAL